MTASEILRALDEIAAAADNADATNFLGALRANRIAIHDYLMSLRLEGAPPELTATYVADALDRFIHTLEFIPLPAGARILELGGNPYFFHILLRRFLRRSTVSAANFFDHNIFSTAISDATHRVSSTLSGEDWTFTYPAFNLDALVRYPLPAQSFDLIFFCETLEHLIVNPLAVFRKIRRLLAPGGYVIITLPNAVRLSNVALMLDGWNFFDLYHQDNGIHGRHNREFTLDEMKALLAHNGFEICRAETRDRFNYDEVPIEALDYSGTRVLPRRKADLVEALRASGGKLEDRGDNLYLLARRPVAEKPARDWTDGEVEAASLPAHDPLRLMVFVDEFHDEASSIHVRGWSFLVDDDAPWARVVFRSGNRAVTARCERTLREDVAQHFGTGVTDVGFLATLPKSALPPGTWTFGIMLGGPGVEPAFRDLGLTVTV